MKSFKYSLALLLSFGWAIGQDTNSQAEEVLNRIGVLASTISGKAYPSGDYLKIVPALQSLREVSDSVGLFGPYLINGGFRDTGFNVTKAFENLVASDNTFGEVEESLSVLFKIKGQPQCFAMFLSSDDMAFIGWYDYLYNFESQTFTSDYQGFCQSGRDINFFIDQIISLFDPTGECDVLRTLFIGNNISLERAGWRDNILDKAAYILLDLFQLITMASACNEYQDQIQYYSTQFSSIIDRILEYDTLAQESIGQTAVINIEDLLSSQPNLNLQYLNENQQYFIDKIYPFVNWIIISLWANQSESDSFLYCNKCVDVQEGQYRQIADWYQQNDTSSSIANLDFSRYIDLEDSSPEDIYNMIFSDTGACFGGILIVKVGTPIAVISELGSIYKSASGSSFEIYAWGSESDCVSSNNIGHIQFSSSSLPQP